MNENGKKPKRRIDQVDVLYDVSPVTYPAYKQTSVTARALQAQSTPQPQGVADKDFPQLLADILQLNKQKA